MKEAFQDLVRQYPKEANDMTEQKGIYVFDLWLKNGSAKDKVAGHSDRNLGAMDFSRQAQKP